MASSMHVKTFRSVLKWIFFYKHCSAMIFACLALQYAGHAKTVLSLSWWWSSSWQALSEALASCGDNIDAAIKRLGELQLTAHCSTLSNVEERTPQSKQAPAQAQSTSGE